MALDHLKQGEIVNLTKYGLNDGSASRRALVKTGQFEAMYVSIEAGKKIPEHSVPGQATVQCLDGVINMILENGTVTLRQGDWMYLGQGQAHAVEGIEQGALLVTILFP
jgi:quercetin dioxygenase-like cupin family protein